MIEYTNNTIIGSGNLDYILPTNGTLLALQNTTWNGLQGLQDYPGTPFYVLYHPEYNGGALSAAGLIRSWGSERGLTFYQVQLSGHGMLIFVSPAFLYPLQSMDELLYRRLISGPWFLELPGYAPSAAYRALELLLGRISSLSDVSDFTTQTGNYTGTSTIARRF